MSPSMTPTAEMALYSFKKMPDKGIVVGLLDMNSNFKLANMKCYVKSLSVYVLACVHSLIIEICFLLCCVQMIHLNFVLCLLGHLLCDIDEESGRDQNKLHCLTVTFYKWFAKVFCC